jgi:hypothetical protein
MCKMPIAAYPTIHQGVKHARSQALGKTVQSTDE